MSVDAFNEILLDHTSDAVAQLADEPWDDPAFAQTFLALVRKEDIKAETPKAKTGKASTRVDYAMGSPQDLLKRAQEAVGEAAKILGALSKKELPEGDGLASDSETEDLRAEIESKGKEIVDLQAEIESKGKEIEDLQAEFKGKDDEIADLKSRLKTVLEMDMSANSQEILTLKNDISRYLEIEYENFKASKDKEYSKDLYEAHYASLFRIFRTLKRLGIKFE
jgi:chromosome segregation ATPase